MAADSKPIKGILKNSASFDQAQESAHDEKKMKWDEMNILATYHPPGKDYGHMKIDDPPTPYHHNDRSAEEEDLDPESLASRLQSDSKPKVMNSPPQEDEDSSNEEEDGNDEDQEKKKAFEQKRKLHYNEFQAVKLARKLLEEADDDDDEEEETKEDETKQEEVSTATENTQS